MTVRNLSEPLDPIFDKEAAARFDHMVVAHGEAHDPAGGFRQIDVNVVGARLEADRVLRVVAEDIAGHHIADVSAIDLAPVLLHELVADRRRKCHEAVEIVEQLQLIPDEISIGVDLPGRRSSRRIWSEKL